MTRIIGCLSWYNESPAMLAACVQSLTFIDHLVAVDGAYATFPSSQPHSAADQASIIQNTCRNLNIGCTIHAPTHPWIGGEVEKRTFLFHLAEANAQPYDDWYYVADADETITHILEHPRQHLEDADEDAAHIMYWWHRPHQPPDTRPFPTPLREQTTIRKFFRAIPGLHVDQAHYRYRTPNGRLLWNAGGDSEPVLDLSDIIRVQHRNAERDLWRQQEAQRYYEHRDCHKLEHVNA